MRLIALLLLAAGPLEAAGELLATARFDAGDGTVLTVRKLLAPDGVRLEVHDGSGVAAWTSPPLGTEDKLFTIAGRATPLACADVTGDGVPELLVAAGSPPHTAALTAYRFEAPRGFAPVPCAFGSDEVVRDAFVTDLAQADGQDLAVLPDGRIRTLGRTYESSGIRRPGAAQWFFVRDGAGYRFEKRAEIPRMAP